MKGRGTPFQAAVIISAWGLAQPAMAGAWNMARGDGLVIVKYEPAVASHYFDADGFVQQLERDRTEEVVSFWAEYGLSDSLTAVVRTDWQDAKDEFTDYSGRGPLEMAVKWQAYRGEQSAVALQMAYARDGDGRNASWAGPGQGENEAEVRILAGRNYFAKYPSYVEGQVAFRWRDDLPDEVRIEVVSVVDFTPRWSLMGQIYGGKATDSRFGVGARWLKVESSLVHHRESWSVQVGWRSTKDGHNITKGQGLIVALWRRF